jgi:hypothetical protein
VLADERGGAGEQRGIGAAAADGGQRRELVKRALK